MRTITMPDGRKLKVLLAYSGTWKHPVAPTLTLESLAQRELPPEGVNFTSCEHVLRNVVIRTKKGDVPLWTSLPCEHGYIAIFHTCRDAGDALLVGIVEALEAVQTKHAAENTH